MTKQGQCSSLGGGGQRGAKLVDNVCVYVCVCTCFFSPYVSLLCMPAPQEDYICVHVFQMCARVGDNQERVHKIRPLITTRSLDLFLPLQKPLAFLPSLSHVHTSLSLILASSSLSPSSTSPSPDPAFSFLPLKSMPHLCAVTFEQKPLRTSQKRH